MYTDIETTEKIEEIKSEVTSNPITLPMICRCWQATEQRINEMFEELYEKFGVED